MFPASRALNNGPRAQGPMHSDLLRHKKKRIGSFIHWEVRSSSKWGTFQIHVFRDSCQKTTRLEVARGPLFRALEAGNTRMFLSVIERYFIKISDHFPVPYPFDSPCLKGGHSYLTPDRDLL